MMTTRASCDEGVVAVTGEKSSEAFKNIREVSEELDVPQHVLRFWESKFSEIRPLKRGGRRRYYRPEDISLLRTIRNLLYVQGYKIRGVQRLLREGKVTTVDSVVTVPPVEELTAEGYGPDAIDFDKEFVDQGFAEENTRDISGTASARQTAPLDLEFEQITVPEDIKIGHSSVVLNRLMTARTKLLSIIQTLDHLRDAA